MRDYFGRGKIQFLFPIDGDCLNSADGRTEGEILYVPVRIKAEGAKSVLVCGKQTEKQGDEFVLDMPVIAGANALTAVADTGDSCKIVVYRFLKAEKGFRISADDNILCLKDIAEHAQEYNSIFNNKYLAIYKEAHEKYGAKAHLNLFYETANLDGFTPDPDYFNLTMMPDKFKEEWEKNSDWLKLSFHSKKENPMWPYKNATAEEITFDCEMVHREIIRFAGKKTLADETTIHFGTATQEGVAALRKLGYRAIAGYFELDDKGNPLVSYFYPKDLIAHVGERDFWMDNELDMLCAKVDRVLNYSPEPSVNVAAIRKAAENSHRGGFLEFLIHEQYFYNNYCSYIPKFREVILECCKFAFENGYTGRFLSDLLK